MKNTETRIDPKTLTRIKNLKEARHQVLSLPADKVISYVVERPEPAALVHSFKEEDFYLLVKEIGPEDALPLLALASDKQWEYILDLEAWEKDRLRMPTLTRWLDLLLKADPERMLKWSLAKQKDLFEYYLNKNIEVRIREDDQSSSDFEDDFFTDDDVFYVRPLDPPADVQEEPTAKEQRHIFLSEFIRRLSRFDHVMYQNFILESANIIPAETEEEVYRLRNVRLAEKGFLPFEEAVGVYQPLKVSELETAPAKHLTDPKSVAAHAPGPLYPVRLLPGDNRFTDALQLLDTETVLLQIQAEFAGLCNQVIAADARKITSKEDLAGVVRKVCGLINLGLEHLAREKKTATAVAESQLLKRLPIVSFFRLGYSLALALKWRADKWHDQSWFAGQGLPLSFWDEEWLGVLGGLLIKRPLFFDNYRTGQLYRDFASYEDIQTTEKALNQMIAVDQLLSLMGVETGTLESRHLITYKNLLLTLWARNYLGLAPAVEPLPLKALKAFFKVLFVPTKSKGSMTAYTISPSMRSLFLGWLTDRSALRDYEITEQLGAALEALFVELVDEYGRVAPGRLDPRYILLFLVEK
jgi:hypothetical protein